MASILVVDDNPGARRFAVAALQRAGHEAQELEPTCLYAVLASLHNHPPDLVLMDLMMPGCPGHTLIRACREDAHLKHLRIMLLTSYGDIQLAQFLQAMGNTHYVAKPVSPVDLVGLVEHLLDPAVETDPGWSLACSGVVAVVDDSNLSRLFHAACLRKRGFRPVQIEPTDLLETVVAIEAAQPDLLLVDYLMPRFNGDALIRAIRGRESLRDIPILVATAHHSEELIAQLLPIGGVEIMFKPFGAEELVDRVVDILGIGSKA
jgi:two-component system cell cycle response regulator